MGSSIRGMRALVSPGRELGLCMGSSHVEIAVNRRHQHELGLYGVKAYACVLQGAVVGVDAHATFTALPRIREFLPPG